MVRCAVHAITIASACLAVAGPASAQAPGRWELGVRAGMVVSDGTPANDMPYGGIVLKMALSSHAKIGLSVDRLEYDFERPWALVGLQQDTALAPEDIDAKAASTLVRVFYERLYGMPSDRWNVYWNAGLGWARPKVPDVSGPAAGGGTFTMRTEPDTEIVPSIGAGVRWNATPRLGIELGATLDHHRTRWRVTDTVSGRRATVKSYTAAGVQLGVSYRF